MAAYNMYRQPYLNYFEAVFKSLSILKVKLQSFQTVNGIPVKNPKSHEKVDAFQRAIRENPILRENFGPNIQEKEGKTKRISGHNNHIHIATQKR